MRFAPKWLIRFLNAVDRPILGTKVIPPNATVSADQFAEDEFPVHCSRCNYLLRGLPDSCCPECGQPFERGRLLVDQYVREHDHALWERGWVGTLAARISVVVLIVCFAWVVGVNLMAFLAYRFSASSLRLSVRHVEFLAGLLGTFNHLIWYGQVASLAVLIGCVVFVTRSRNRHADKRHRVFAAWQEQNPG